MLTKSQRKLWKLTQLLWQRRVESYCEVGVLEGDSAWEVLQAVNSKVAVLIDNWKPYPATRALSPTNGWDKHALRTNQELEQMYQSVIERFQGTQAVILRGDSAAIAGILPPDSFDAVFIDADHTYEAVSRDLAAYFRVVKSGGLLIGDDYNSRAERLRGFWGVKRAVDEFAESRGLELTLHGSKLWSLEKP